MCATPVTTKTAYSFQSFVNWKEYAVFLMIILLMVTVKFEHG